MNYFLKQKTWFYISLFFMVVNVVLLSGMFLNKRHHHGDNFKHGEESDRMHGERRPHGPRGARHRGPNPVYRFIDSLGFTGKQAESLKKTILLLEEHKDSMINAGEIARDLFLKEAYSETPDTKRSDSLAQRIAFLTENYYRMRAASIDLIRGSCNAEQKQKLISFLREFQKGPFQNRHK